jgi:hypothetical protein
MGGKKTAVFGIYQNQKQAERTVDDLFSRGLLERRYGGLLPDNQGIKDFAHDKSTKGARRRGRGSHNRRSDRWNARIA